MSGALRFVLGDQLSRGISSLQGIDRERDVVLIAEVTDETTYVPHHKKKIAFLFAAMRHFAKALRRDGITVDYVPLDAPDNAGSLRGELGRAIGRHAPERVIVTEPGEYRVQGDKIAIDAIDGAVMVDDARVVQADVEAETGSFT